MIGLVCPLVQEGSQEASFLVFKSRFSEFFLRDATRMKSQQAQLLFAWDWKHSNDEELVVCPKRWSRYRRKRLSFGKQKSI
jgi:hypothetical protein